MLHRRSHGTAGASCAVVLGLSGLVGAALHDARVVVAEPTAEIETDPTVCVDDMDLDDRVGQVLLALVDDPTAVAAAVRAGDVAGFAPLGSVSADESKVIESLVDAGRYGTLIASDEEGGTVQRFRDLLGPLPSARRQYESMSVDEVRSMYHEYGEALAALGVSMAFAPVVDVGGGPAIGSRSYRDNPDTVTRYAGAVVAGYQLAGIVPVLKHFPGHGSASADTHDGAATTPPLSELRERDLLPYRALLGDPFAAEAGGAAGVAVMIGHLDVPGLTDGLPASLSEAAITGLLRDELGFDGLVISDAVGMGAILQLTTAADAVIRFLLAGGDLALVNAADVATVRDSLIDAVTTGQLPEARLAESVERVLRTKGFSIDCAASDLPAAAPEDSVEEAVSTEDVEVSTPPVATDLPVATDADVTAPPPPPQPASWSEIAVDAAIAAIVANLGTPAS